MDNSSNETQSEKTQYQSPAIANPALWPFSTAKGPVEGWHRSTLESRTPLIKDCGGGVRLYPPYTEGGPLRTVQPWPNEIGLLCSGQGCEHAVEGCVHCWEDRFRFGDLAGGNYCPPTAMLKRKKGNEDGEDPAGYERHLTRPNPIVDGLTFEEIMRRAREAMPAEFPGVLAALTRTLKREHAYEDIVAGKKRGRGRTYTGIYDLAMMAIIRVHERLAYEELAERIDRYCEHGDDDGPFLNGWFDYARIIEAMTGYTKDKDPMAKAVAELRLTHALEEILDRLTPLFADVTTVVGADGMALSTGATDNARLKHVPRTRAAVLNFHVMYEMRWGIITAWRLTWHNRGLGSAESPQFPYLITATIRANPNTKVFLGDGSYGSARNRALCLAKGIDLFVELKEGQFKGNASNKWLSKAQVEAEKRRCSITNPLFCQVYPFRNRVEGWHEVIRNQSERNLISRVKAKRPETLIELKKQAMQRGVPAADIAKAARDPEFLKNNPVLADLTLPEDQNEIEAIIASNQWTGRATHNEMLCRQIMTYIRAIVKAQMWYKTRVNFAAPKPFQPRPEDDLMSIFRPRIDKDWAA
jgi:hypothetical protein